MIRYAFFTDFDGTITKCDTCEAMVKTFAQDGWEEINRLWEQKLLSTQECAEQTFRLFNAVPDDITQLMATIEIDEYFKDFINLVKKRGEKLTILSDGYDLCIKTVLMQNDICLPFYANKLIYNGRFMIECINSNETCSLCGTCKKNLMEMLREKCETVVYIGDGYSDQCPAEHADIVFAKGSLTNYCNEKSIKYFPFNNFKDIINSIESGEAIV